jgi:hypothetical protein
MLSFYSLILCEVCVGYVQESVTGTAVVGLLCQQSERAEKRQRMLAAGSHKLCEEFADSSAAAIIPTLLYSRSSEEQPCLL